jgi:uroporphyrinogen decarboxylase
MDDLFLRACRREPTERTPVWFLRQAGRYQPEYRRIRQTHSLLDICRDPALAARVTRLPVEQLGVDAAILFSDIVVPVAAMGVSLEIREGVGPVIASPMRTGADVARLRPLDPPRDVPFVLEAVSSLARELPVPLIGFAGAPFTLAAYLVEGGPSKTYANARRLMLAERSTWAALMDALADAVLAYLRAQVAAGASAVQLFDSWVGNLSVQDYRTSVAPWSARILGGLADLGVPLIHFGVGTGELLADMRDAGATVVGVDWRTPLDDAWSRVGEGVGVQGNLDPVAVTAGWDVASARTIDVLERAGGRPGHVFNLGHGVLPETDPAVLRKVVDLVRERSAR